MKLLDIFGEACSTSPESLCCILGDDSADEKQNSFLSYSSVWRCIEQHQVWLKEAIDSFLENETSNDVAIVYISSNSIDFLLSLLACTGLNKTSTALLNIRWTAMEMSSALQSKDRNAKTIILYGTGFESIGQQVTSQLGHRSNSLPLPNFSSLFMQQNLVFDRPQKSAYSLSQAKTAKQIENVISSGSSEDALIIFTSGTTGGSKGVRLSHRAIAVQSLAKIGRPCEYSNETTMLASTVPLFHVGGLSSCLSVLFSGGRLFFPDSKSSLSFDVNLVRSLLNQYTPVNTLVVVPAMLVSILGDKQAPDTYPKVKLILIGGQSASNSIIEKISEKFPNARIVQTYACTEAASSLTFLHVNPKLSVSEGNSDDVSGDCVGLPPSHVNLRLYRKSGRTTKIVNEPNQVGVIATRGSHVMNGYWDRGAKRVNINGWFLTTDLGFFNERGQLYFSGRVKDVIRSGGETVLANEVERIILMHPHVSECAVFPRQDEKFGEAVACALISLSPLKLDSIKSWCAQNGLANYKRPRYIFLVDELPKNSSGKILKHKLVATFGRIRRSKL